MARPRRRLGGTPNEVDAGRRWHRDLLVRFQAHRAHATGRPGTFELPTRPLDPSRSTDVGIRDDRHRCLIQAECWNTIADDMRAGRILDAVDALAYGLIDAISPTSR